MLGQNQTDNIWKCQGVPSAFAINGFFQKRYKTACTSTETFIFRFCFKPTLENHSTATLIVKLEAMILYRFA